MKVDLRRVSPEVCPAMYELLKIPNSYHNNDWWAKRIVKYSKRMRKFAYSKQHKKARYKKALARFYRRHYL